MAYNKGLKYNDQTFNFAIALTGTEAPTTSTEGVLGQPFFVITNNKIASMYVCTNVADTTYTWGKVSLGENGIKYVTQALTDAQKKQARTNIGAGTSSFSGSYNDLTNKPNIPAATVIDTTLSKSGQAADAKAAGDAIAQKLDKSQGVENAGMILGVDESGNVAPEDKPVQALAGASAPTTATAGVVGQEYYVIVDNAVTEMYVCTSALIGSYTWDKVEFGGEAYVSVRAFGAKGDGTTDDTVAIRAARDAAKTSGQPLYFPAGTYLVSGCIQLYSNMHVIGAQNAKIKKKAAVTQALTANVTVGDSVVYVEDASQYSVGQDCYIGSTESGSYGDTCAKIVAIDTSTNAITISAYNRHTGTGISAAHTTENGVFSSTFSILCSFRGDDAGGNITIEHITLDGNKQTGEPKAYQLSPIHTDPNLEHIRIHDVQSINSPADGISVQSAGDVVVDRCVVKGSSYHGVHVGYTISGVCITNNMVYDAPACGVFDCYNVHNLIINSNAFYRCGQGVGGLDEYSENTVISGNTFEDCAIGVYARAPFGVSIIGNAFSGSGSQSGVEVYVSSNALIDGNIFNGLGRALLMKRADYITFTNNHVKDCVLAIDMGYQDTNPTLKSSYNKVCNNTFYANMSGRTAKLNIKYAKNMMIAWNIFNGNGAEIAIDSETTGNIVCENNMFPTEESGIAQSGNKLAISSGVSVTKTDNKLAID